MFLFLTGVEGAPQFFQSGLVRKVSVLTVTGIESLQVLTWEHYNKVMKTKRGLNKCWLTEFLESDSNFTASHFSILSTNSLLVSLKTQLSFKHSPLSSSSWRHLVPHTGLSQPSLSLQPAQHPPGFLCSSLSTLSLTLHRYLIHHPNHQLHITFSLKIIPYYPLLIKQSLIFWEHGFLQYLTRAMDLKIMHNAHGFCLWSLI